MMLLPPNAEEANAHVATISIVLDLILRNNSY